MSNKTARWAMMRLSIALALDYSGFAFVHQSATWPMTSQMSERVLFCLAAFARKQPTVARCSYGAGHIFSKL